jgi:hypothetical protein
MKYKAMIVIREQVINDVNHAAWRTNKTKVLNLPQENGVAPINTTISYEDVLYDVDFTTWKMANVRMADNKEAASEAQTDKENERWFQRQYKVAIEHVRDTLRPHVYLNAEIKENDDNTFQFRFSKAWTGSISALMSYIHHYIVDFILYEWFRLTMPNEAASFITTSEDWKAKALTEAQSEEENFDWFERQLATAVDYLKGSLRWCVSPCEHLGTIVDNTIKTKAITYGEAGNPSVAHDPDSFADDEAFLDAPSEVYVPIPEHVFRFKFSDAWRGNFESLGSYIHRYIVDYILYEWFKSTMPNEAAAYLTSAAEWERKMIHEARSEDVSNVFFRL